MKEGKFFVWDKGRETANPSCSTKKVTQADACTSEGEGTADVIYRLNVIMNLSAEAKRRQA